LLGCITAGSLNGLPAVFVFLTGVCDILGNRHLWTTKSYRKAVSHVAAWDAGLQHQPPLQLSSNCEAILYRLNLATKPPSPLQTKPKSTQSFPT
jgi:hypothetical protein